MVAAQTRVGVMELKEVADGWDARHEAEKVVLHCLTAVSSSSLSFYLSTSPACVSEHKNQHIKSVFVNCHISRDTVTIAAEQFSLGRPGGNQIVLKNTRAEQGNFSLIPHDKLDNCLCF